MLRSRQGEPFTIVDGELLEVAVIAAAIYRAGQKGPADAGRAAVQARPAEAGWKMRARLDGLRV